MKRIACVLMACSIAAAAFAAGQTESKNEPKAQPSATQKKAPGALPIVDQPQTIRIFFQQEPQVLDYANNKLTAYLEGKTNIKIDWDLVLAKDKTQKMNLILATNQGLPDVFMGGMDTSLVVAYAAQGTFVPLNKYIDNDSKYLQEVFKQIPDLKKIMTAPDGNIYALPSVNLSEPNMMASRLWINKTWLEKLKLNVPTTTDELKAVLAAFKANDPNGNGKADEIALMGATTGWNTNIETFVLNSFLQYPNTASYPNSTQRYTAENGVVQAPFTKDAYREGLKYLNDLVKSELLDASSFTQDIAQLKQIFESPNAARLGAVASGGPNAHANMGGDRFKDYVVVPPLKGPKGVRLANYNPYQYVNQANCYVITKACKNPEAAFRFADLMYSQDVSMRTRLGEPGTDWVMNPTGKTAVDGGSALFEPILVYGSQQKSHWQNRNVYYNFFDNKGVKSDNPFELQGLLWKTMLQYKPYVPAVENCMPPLIFTAEESKELNEINSVLNQFIDENRVKFILGGNIDAGWNAYIAELDKIGLKRVVEITQASYNRYKNAK